MVPTRWDEATTYGLCDMLIGDYIRIIETQKATFLCAVVGVCVKKSWIELINCIKLVKTLGNLVMMVMEIKIRSYCD